MMPIGIALDGDRLVAVLAGGRRLEADDAADLPSALTELKNAVGVARAQVSIALLPPLVDVRRVRLPPLRPEERRRVLERDAARYFVGVREAQVVATEGSLAAAAAARLVEEIEVTLAAIGWDLHAIVPAHIVWAAQLGDGDHAVRLVHATELLRVEHHRLVERARLRPGESAPPGADFDPYVLAAEHVSRVRKLELCSAPRRAERRKAAQRIAAKVGSAAVVCLLVAAGVDYWGLGRELTILHERRQALAPSVAAAMRLRDSIGAASAVAQTLGGLDATNPSWSSVFADLADDLPRDAYVAAFEAKGDSFALTGVAREASGVMQGLERVSRVAGIHADGPIRQDVTPAGEIREQFRFAARVTP